MSAVRPSKAASRRGRTGRHDARARLATQALSARLQAAAARSTRSADASTCRSVATEVRDRGRQLGHLQHHRGGISGAHVGAAPDDTSHVRAAALSEDEERAVTDAQQPPAKRAYRKRSRPPQGPMPLYHSLMSAIEHERHRQGLSLVMLEDKAGISEGHLAKLNHPGEGQGSRVGTWATLQLIVDALFPDGGATIKLIPHGRVPASAPISSFKLKILKAYHRQMLAQIAASGGIARMERLTHEQRRDLGRRGAEARWRHKRRLHPRTPQHDG